MSLPIKDKHIGDIIYYPSDYRYRYLFPVNANAAIAILKSVFKPDSKPFKSGYHGDIEIKDLTEENIYNNWMNKGSIIIEENYYYGDKQFILLYNHDGNFSVILIADIKTK